MMNIRDIVQGALDVAMYPLGVTSHWQQLEPTGNEKPAEYITYSIVSTTQQGFANNVPVSIIQAVDVNYYAQKQVHDRRQMQQRIKQIQKAMLAAGFTVPEEGNDLLDPGDSGWVGIHMECWLYRLVENVGD